MSIYMVWKILIFVSFGRSKTIDRTLLMLREGGQIDLVDVWSIPGSVNDPNGVKHSWDMYNLTRNGNFRSYIIDNWKSHTPDMISINLYNTQGDKLWWIKFNSSLSLMDLSSWMSPGKILGSSSNITRDNVVMQMDKLKFQAYLSSKSDPNRAWFSVWNGEEYTEQYPVFLFSTWYNIPQPLFTTDFEEHSDYRGCWPGYSLERGQNPVKEDPNFMTLEMCNAECLAAGKQFILIEARYKCWCGKFRVTPLNRFDSLCRDVCPGNPLQICGKNEAMHAVYPVQHAKVPVIPMSAVLWKTIAKVLVTGQKEFMINDSEFFYDPNFPAFINAVAVNLTNQNKQLDYHLYYNQWNCVKSTRKPYRDENGHIKMFRTNSVVSHLEIIPVRCAWIKFAQPSYVADTTALIQIFRPKDMYFAAAPALAIIGHWNTDITTHVVTTIKSTTAIESSTVSDLTTTIPSNELSTTVVERTKTRKASTYAMPITTDITEFTSDSTIDKKTDTDTTASMMLTAATTKSTIHNLVEADDTTSVKESTTYTASQTSGKTEDGLVITSEVTSCVSDSIVGDETSTQKLPDISTDSDFRDRTALSTASISTEYVPKDSPTDSTTKSTLSVSDENSSKTTFYLSTTSTINNKVDGKIENTTQLPCLCSCQSNNLIFNNTDELQEHIQQIQKNLTVNKTNLSSHIRKLTSAPDHRVSAQRIGYLGASMLAVVIGLILMIDLIDVIKYVKRRTKRRKDAFSFEN